MKIRALLENTSACPGILCEHGLSLWIEFGSLVILFDSGETGIFADNARAMGLDLNRVDAMILSHGHSDHGGGIARFLKENDHAPVYVSRYAFDLHYGTKGNYNGIDQALKDNPRIRPLGEYTALAAGIEVYACNEGEFVHKIRPFGLLMDDHGRKVPEDFRHEQYLVLTERGKRTVISGCSHKGILNVMHWLHPDVLIGGFHFMNVVFDDEGCAYLDAAAEELLSYDCTYYTCHCTGLTQYGYLKARMGKRLSYLAGGGEIDL
ncbi:MAG: MBL fold metallo-hydrolase [Lachnospiraceae bacterium]|nr:MBL fold metallo-hydrolase [Lachnospiraceae bacterium]MBR0153124.1 MBL fold metallo-hydrolase [Lachnospiraceae bacterium]